MARITDGFVGKSVTWNGTKLNHDNTILLQSVHKGIVYETHWENTTLWCVVVEPSGVITQHEATDLVLVHPVNALPHDKFLK